MPTCWIDLSFTFVTGDQAGGGGGGLTGGGGGGLTGVGGGGLSGSGLGAGAAAE